MTITRNFSVLANGAGSANNLSLGGATLGSNALAVTGTTAISKASAGDALTWTNGGATPKTGYLYSDSGVVAMFNVAGAGAGRNGIQISSTAVILDINAGANTANFTASGLGIGMTPSNVLDITQSQNAASQVKLLNSNGSSGAQSNFFASNGTNTAQFGIWGTGATTSGAVTAGNAFVYGDNGISYFTGGTHKWYISTNTEAARINTSGTLLVGTTSSWTGCAAEFRAAGNALSAYNTASSGTAFVSRVDNTGAKLATWNYNGSDVGTVTTNGTITVYGTTSDYRLKENVQPMTGGLATVAALKPVTYDWISNGSAGEGFIAHELQAIIPEAVHGEKDALDKDGKIDPQGVDFGKIVPHLVAAIQELTTRLAALEAK